MNFWANRQISTGMFLPAGGKGKRGHTHQEPSATEPPRLFVSKVLAERALKAWLQGKWTDSGSYQEHSGEWNYDGPEPTKGTERKAEDFRTVCVWLETEAEHLMEIHNAFNQGADLRKRAGE